MAAELKPAYLIVGSDRPKIARALRRLRSRSGEESLEATSARDASGDDVVASCNSLGLFGGGDRLVVVSEVERWKAADVKAVAAYLENPSPQTVLALTGDVKADSALGKAVGKRGEVLAFDVSKRGLPGWVGEQFQRVGATAEQSACTALVELVGDDLDELEAEIDKLATWAAGERIGVRDVQQVAAGRAESSIFSLTDAWGRRDVGAALDPLLAFTRGHPQRTMLVAHHLWELVPRGSVADESAFVDAREHALALAEPALRARWESLAVNEQRVSLALATRTRNLYAEETLNLLGLKKGSVDRALAGLIGKAEVRRTPAGPELTDPLLEHWLAERGLF